LKIMLAEDLPANQKLMAHILQRRGHTVEVADNGMQALDLMRRSKFDLALLDVEMPLMDGVQVTTAIRALEQGSRAHLPIVAMTAHALREDRERYLRAGMDAYLAKPFDTRQFVEIVEQFGRQTPPQSACTDASANTGPGDTKTEKKCLDFEAALRRLDGDTQLFNELAGFFAEDSPALLEAIRAGLQRHDARTVERAAHSLKGLVATFGSEAAFESASSIEKLAQQGQFEEVPVVLDRLTREVSQLQDALEPYRAGGSGPAGA
jgi:two-component system, sensor histidine kinase and response regulator